MADGDDRTDFFASGAKEAPAEPADPRTSFFASGSEPEKAHAAPSASSTRPDIITRGITKLEHVGQDIWRGIGGDAAGYRASTTDTSPQALAAAREAQEYGGYSPQADAAASDAAAHAATVMGGGMLGAGAGAAVALGSGAAGQGDVRAAQRTQDIVGRALTYQPQNPNAVPAAQSFDAAMSLPALASQRVLADPLKSVLPASAGPKVDYLAQFAPMLIDPALRGARLAGGALGRVGAAPLQPWETGAGAPGAAPPAPSPGAGRGMESSQAMGAAPVGRGAEGAEALRQPEKNGQFSPEDQADRVEALRKVGITGSVRQSALEGNANDAGLQAGLTRFDALPEGRAAGEHFEQNERQPLIQHAENILDDLGSTSGTDPKTVRQRGSIIAQGVDSLRDWIKAQTDGLYAEARSVGGTTPTTTLGRVRDLLNGTTPEAQDFQARVGSTADGEKLLATMRNKLERDDATTGGAYNSNNAEDFRKFFNSAGVWSSDRAWAIRQLQHATDDDMFESAGADVFQRGRQMHALSKTLLDDDPRLAKIFEVDPKGNRTTPVEHIPDRLLNLPQDSLNRFVELMQGAPADLQADTQAALNQARGHLVNEVLDVGAREGQVQRTFWNADGVHKALRAHQLARESLFADAPQADEALTDLENAGNILKVDPVYRGAAAQTHSITDFLERHSEMTGGTIGGSLGGAIGGPIGAGIGSGVGSAAARRIIAPFAERMRESRGNARWAEGMTDVGDADELSAGNGRATPPPSDRAGSIIPTLPPRATPRQAPPPPPPGSGGPPPGAGPAPPPGAPTGRSGVGTPMPPPTGAPPPGAAPEPSGAPPAPSRSRGASSGMQARTAELARQLEVPESAIDGRVRGLSTQIGLHQRRMTEAHTDAERQVHQDLIENLEKERDAVIRRNIIAAENPKGGVRPSNNAPPGTLSAPLAPQKPSGVMEAPLAQPTQAAPASPSGRTLTPAEQEAAARMAALLQPGTMHAPIADPRVLEALQAGVFRAPTLEEVAARQAIAQEERGATAPKRSLAEMLEAAKKAKKKP